MLAEAWRTGGGVDGANLLALTGGRLLSGLALALIVGDHRLTGARGLTTCPNLNLKVELFEPMDDCDLVVKYTFRG